MPQPKEKQYVLRFRGDEGLKLHRRFHTACSFEGAKMQHVIMSLIASHTDKVEKKLTKSL